MGITCLFNYFFNFGEFTMIGDVKLAPWSIIIVDTWMWTPFTMLICLAGLKSIPNYLYEISHGSSKETYEAILSYFYIFIVS